MWPLQHSGSQRVLEPLPEASYITLSVFAKGHIKRKTAIHTSGMFKVPNFLPREHIFWLPVAGSCSHHTDCGRTCKLHTKRNWTQRLNPLNTHSVRNQWKTAAPPRRPGLTQFYFSTTFCFWVGFFFLDILMKWSACVVVWGRLWRSRFSSLVSAPLGEVVQYILFNKKVWKGILIST